MSMEDFQIKVVLAIALILINALQLQICQVTSYGQHIGLCKCPPTSSLINGECKACQVSNCILCSLDSNKECDVCRVGYTLDALTKSECVPAQNLSLSCTSKACSCSVYEVYKDGYCVSCQVKNCLLCSTSEPTQCDVCQRGYVLDNLTQNQCVPKTNFTLSCSLSTASCACSPYQVNVNGVCTNCAVSNCQLCSTTSAKECDICKSGYVLDTLTKSTCILKSNSTLSCSSSSPSSPSCGCTVYEVNINGLCVACQVSNCKLCAVANPFECDVCNSGYTLDKLTKQQCVLKLNSTLTCSSNNGKCSCSPYSVQNSNGSCSACEVSNCILCSWNNSKECDVCKSGYILDKLSQTVCLLPQTSAISCSPNSNFCQCSAYQLNIDGVCTDCKSKNCRLCSATDPNDCDVCQPYYLYNTTTKQCDEPVCSLENQIWVNSQCECNTIISFKNSQGKCELYSNQEKYKLTFAVGVPLLFASFGIIVATYLVSLRNGPLAAQGGSLSPEITGNQMLNRNQQAY